MAGWIDLELDDEAQLDGLPIIGAAGKPVLPRYPWGMKICLDGEIVKAMDDIDGDIDLDAVLIFKAKAVVTSAARLDNGEARVELQITHIKPIMLDDGNEACDDEDAEEAAENESSGLETPPKVVVGREERPSLRARYRGMRG